MCKSPPGTSVLLIGDGIRNVRDWCCHLTSDATADGNTSVSWESVYRISREWVDSWLRRFCDGSQKFAATVHHMLCKSREKCDGDISSVLACLLGRKYEYRLLLRVHNECCPSLTLLAWLGLLRLFSLPTTDDQAEKYPVYKVETVQQKCRSSERWMWWQRIG